jgi:hypothetical protein
MRRRKAVLSLIPRYFWTIKYLLGQKIASVILALLGPNALK